MSIVILPATRALAAPMLVLIGAALGACVRPQTSPLATSAQLRCCPCSGGAAAPPRFQFTDDQLAVAASAMRAAQFRMDLCVANCANVQTPGFKARKPLFEAIGQNDQAACTSMLDIQQGALIVTHAPLDVAVQGTGWFQVRDEGGRTLYTRDGRFTRNTDGELITVVGRHPLTPTIVVPSEACRVYIQADGVVAALFANQVEPEALGQIELATFQAPEFLGPINECLYAETARSGPPSPAPPDETVGGQLIAGFYESSNVDPIAQRMQMDHIRVVQSMWSGITNPPATGTLPPELLRTSQATRTPAETR